MTQIGYTLLFSTVLLFGSSRSEAQQPTRVPRIGILIPEAGLDESQTLKGVKEGLKKAGYNEDEKSRTSKALGRSCSALSTSW